MTFQLRRSSKSQAIEDLKAENNCLRAVQESFWSIKTFLTVRGKTNKTVYADYSETR